MNYHNPKGSFTASENDIAVIVFLILSGFIVPIIIFLVGNWVYERTNKKGTKANGNVRSNHHHDHLNR